MEGHWYIAGHTASICTHMCGLITFSVDNAALHVFPKRRDFWVWGYQREHDVADIGDFRNFGFGPLFLFCWWK